MGSLKAHLTCWCSHRICVRIVFAQFTTKGQPNTLLTSLIAARPHHSAAPVHLIILCAHRLPNGVVRFVDATSRNWCRPKKNAKLWCSFSMLHVISGDSLIFTPDFSCVWVWVGASVKSVRQENVSIFKYPNMFCHCSTTSSVAIHSIQFNEDIRVCVDATPPLDATGTQRVRASRNSHGPNGTATGSVLSM